MSFKYREFYGTGQNKLGKIVVHSSTAKQALVSTTRKLFDRYDRTSMHGICSIMIALYHQIKTLIGFWYRQGLNPKSFIWWQEVLLIELIGTHQLEESFVVKHIKKGFWDRPSL